MSSAVQIASNMNELKQINTEIKRLTTQIKILKEKKKEIDENIIEYLKDNDSDAIRYKDLIVQTKEKKHREKKKKIERENDILNVLQQAGVNDSVKVLDGIKSALRGKEFNVSCLKVKETNDGDLYIV
jgi:septal ring factor EnvC (AmiA/AmiB activator)